MRAYIIAAAIVVVLIVVLLVLLVVRFGAKAPATGPKSKPIPPRSAIHPVLPRF